MGIPNRKKGRMARPSPASSPKIEIDSSEIRELGQRVRDKGALGWGKPDDVQSFEVAWGMCDEKPGSVDDFPNKVTATAKPGPWGDIRRAFVP